MKQFVLTLLLFSLFVSNLSSQLTDVSVTTGVFREEYSVNSANERQGRYEKFYYKKLIAEGDYLNGKREGEWSYYIEPNYTLTMWYSNDTLSGLITLHQRRRLILRNDLKSGSVRSYYPNGSIKIEADSVGNVREFTEFFQNGKIKASYRANGERRVYDSKENILLIGDSTSNGYLIERFFQNGNLKSREVTTGSLTNVIEFNEKDDIIEDIDLKDGIPYNIRLAKSSSDTRWFYSGFVEEGNGIVAVYYINSSGREPRPYLYERFHIKDSKPHGSYARYNSKDQLIWAGRYEEGFRIGEWITIDPLSGAVKERENRVISDSLTYKAPVRNIRQEFVQPVDMSEEQPLFQGGDMRAFSNYISRQVLYPRLAQELGVEGRVVVGFVVEHTGQVNNVEVLSSPNQLLEEEAVRVVSQSPPWLPGFMDGIPVRIRYTIHVNFALER